MRARGGVILLLLRRGVEWEWEKGWEWSGVKMYSIQMEICFNDLFEYLFLGERVFG